MHVSAAPTTSKAATRSPPSANRSLKASSQAMSYTRNNPSANYRRMVSLYRELHTHGERVLGLSPDETYPGISMLPHTKRIKELIDQTGARTVLDYGCGK